MPPLVATHTATWLWTGQVVRCKLQLLLTLAVPAGSGLHSATCKVWFTGRCLQQLKNTHNFINIKNRTHTDIKFLIIKT